MEEERYNFCLFIAVLLGNLSCGWRKYG